MFWSWQSDTPGETGRFPIRDALADAINHLKLPPDIEEPTASERLVQYSTELASPSYL
jgi:hypothetical protein